MPNDRRVSTQGPRSLHRTGAIRGIQPAHAQELARVLAALEAAAPSELSLPAFRLHPLRGGLKGHWSIWVNGNWRVTFRFIGLDVDLVDYQDYH